MKAISTKYLSATNFRGSRIKAFDCDNNAVTIPYPHELSGEDVHRKAAEALRDKMGWKGDLAGGGTKDGYVFTFREKTRFIIVVQGGVVQEVISDQPVEALLIDHDVEQSSGQAGEGVTVIDTFGEAMQVNFCDYAVDVNPQQVEHYFKQRTYLPVGYVSLHIKRLKDE